MGKYSNVNYRSLSNAVRTALSEINRYDLDNDINTLNNPLVLESKSKDKILGTLKNISNSRTITGSVAKLKEKLNVLKNVVDNIDSYQSVEIKIDSLKKRRINSDGTINQMVEREIRNKTVTLNIYETTIDDLLR